MTQSPFTSAAPWPPIAGIAADSGWTDVVRACGYEGMAGGLAEAWACGVGAWADYACRLAASQTPLAVFEAGVQLMSDSLNIYSRAAGVRLRDSGIDTPLLNDA